MPTTIQISEEVREKLKEFGDKGETYNDIILKLYESAVHRQLQDILMSTKGTMTVDEAIKRHKSRWSQ